jgi:TM2 domain-containing membrane protein YozV
MSESEQYTLRWRGRQSGPYTLEEINRLLDDHTIGMGHEIQYEEKWITVEEFLVSRKQAAPVARSPEPRAPVPAPSPAVTLPPKSRPPVASAPGKPQKHGQPFTPAAKQAPVRSPRRRLVYALLGIGFGFSGLHNYYARHWLTGLLQLLLSLATLLLGFGIIAPWLWALVEAVVVRKDGYGMEML